MTTTLRLAIILAAAWAALLPGVVLGEITFGPIRNIAGPYTDGATSVFAVDIDGDGDLDVLSASYFDDGIAWHENRLNEEFADFGPIQDISTDADSASTVFAADLDGDGDPDVIYASSNDDRIAWYENRLNEQRADFGPRQTITTVADGAWSLFAVDLDGDGDIDLLSASTNDDRIAWYENRLDEASADFGPQRTITTAADAALCVFAADLDGDGDPDVLSASGIDDRIAWYENRLNEASEDFGPQRIITAGANGAQSVFAADLDGDGDTDVLSASKDDDRIAWYENRLNEASADFGPQQTITTAADGAWWVFAADLDGDGDMDVLSASALDNRIAWHENRLDEASADFGAQQTITTEKVGAGSLFAADLDGDGDLDVLSGSRFDSPIVWHENRLDEASGDFGPRQPIRTVAEGAQLVIAADLDGDGDPDVLSASADDSRIAWYENRLNEASGDFGPQKTITTAAAFALSVFAADLDGDGDLDVLSASAADDRIAWHENRLNEASADFGPQRTITTSADGASCVFASDLDGDGDLDVLSASVGDRRFAWYENRLDEASADFGPQQSMATNVTGAFAMLAADLDGDSDPDVLFGGTGLVAWSENRLDEAIPRIGSLQVITIAVAGVRSVFAADLDGDGDPDVLSASYNDDRIAWYENRLNEPAANFGPQQTITTAADNAWAVYAVDLDGDGDLDVLSASEYDSRIAWYENRLNEPSQDFGPQQTITTSALFARSVFAADLDGDGDLDVLSASAGDDRIAWFENLTPLPASIAVDTAPSPDLTLAFGDFELGAAPAALDAVVSNTGEAELLVTASLSDDGGGAFGLAAVPDSPLAGGGSSTLTITFAPTGLGAFGGEVTLESNDASNPLVTIALSGTGIDTIAPTSAVTSPSGTLSQPAAAFDVAFAASDSGSGVAGVELFYRRDGGGFVQLPGGPFAASPITFDTSVTGGEGTYEFYTVATDGAGNVEPAPASGDVTVVFNDTTGVGDWGVLRE